MLSKLNVFNRLLPSQTTSGITSGFVGAIICWTVGIGLAAAAVAFAVDGGLKVKIVGVFGLLFAGMICGWARTASSRWKLRLGAVFVSAFLAVLVSEVALRFLTHFPVNTTSNMVPDLELGYVLDSTLNDVDQTGFRNPEVLAKADIVAIGDSHTQGFNAASEHSWPQQLAVMLNQTVYNMGVGGYGPLQYEVLIARALQMQPKQIVVGLYLGNDLGDVVRGIQRKDSAREVENSFRHNLKFHTATGSAINQLVKHSRFGRPAGFEVAHPVNPTYVASQRINGLSVEVDLSDPQIAAAFEKTIGILADARQRCANQGVRLVVMLIPTKESVYASCEKCSYDLLPNELKQLVQRESDLRNRMQSELSKRSIDHVDVLPSLAAAVDASEDVYSAHDDGHPLAEGYRAYAQALAAGGQASGAVLTN